MKHLFLSTNFYKFLLISISFLCVAYATHAQISPSLAVFPEKFELSLVRGEERHEELRLSNQTDAALPLHLRVVRWEAADEVGGINFIDDKEDISFDVTQWVELEETDIILEARETRKLPFTITVPEAAEPGGKYGAIFVEAAFPDIYFNEQATRVLPRIGILLLFDIPRISLEGGVKQELSFEEFGVANRSAVMSEVVSRVASIFSSPQSAFAKDLPVSVDVLSQSPSSLVVRIKNEGITHVKPHGTITIFNSFGAKVAEADISPTTTLPGKVRRLPIELSAPNVPLLPRVVERQLSLGRYRATIVLSGVGQEPFVKTLSYWVFPWQGLLILLMFSGPVVYAGWKFRKRFSAAFSAFMGHLDKIRPKSS